MNDLLEQFPVELFESREIFDQIVGPQLLQLLSVDQLNSILNQHLPSILSNEEKSQTFHLLLQNQLTNFGRNPMDAVYTRLKLQKLSPDLLRTLEEVRQLKARALRLEEQKLQCKLLNEVMLRRKNAFEQMLNGSGDSNPSSTGGSPTQQNKKLLNKVCNQYRNEIKVTKQEFSASSSSSDEFEGHKLISSNANLTQNGQQTLLNKLASQNTLLMKRHHRRKESTNTNSVPESRDGASTDSSNDPTLESVIERVRCDKNLITEMFDLDLSLNDESKKRKLKTVIISNEKVGTAKSNMDSWKKLKTQVILNKDPKISSMITNLTNQNDQLTENKPKVPTITEPPPKYFFKLLRDAFKRDTSKKCFNLAEIESNLKHEFAKLDIIYTFSQDVIRKALDFLKGVVPVAQVVFRLDEKEEPTLWEWSGTDSVNELMLSQLCEKWCNELARNQRMDSQYIPLAICPTTWTVRSSTMEEKQLFRQQETKRYETPHRPYTYYQHGYASVVGPVKGCILVKDATIHYNSSNKARDHSMLIKDRPTFVTLLSIVRDAVARLPNGEGTKADIGELLKDSQFLLDSITDQQLNAILARNLDRLHGERDSCVKFDPSRRLWIYLHRNRSEKDFERLHRMQLEANKVRRPAARAQKTKPAIAAVLNKKVITTTTSSSLSPAPPSYSSSISITKANFESALLVNADGSAHSVVNASLQQTDPLKNDKDSAIGTLVPISLNSDANLNSVQVVKLKKAAVPKRKLIDHLSSLSLTSEQLRTVEVENKEIGTSNSMQTKAVKLKTSKKTMKKLHPDSSNGFTPATGNDCNKPVSVSCNLTNANIGNVFHVNSNSAGKTAVIITKPMAKGSNTTAIKLPKQIQIQTQPSNNNSSVTHRISIPTSMLFNANGGPVVLASNSNCLNGIKSLVMSASGGKIVLHPQNTNNLSGIVNGATVGKGGINSGNLATGEPILSLRTIQGIRVLPVSSSNVTVLNGTGGAVSAASIGSSQPNVVARIVATNAGTINNNKMPATTTRQVVLPISNTNPNNNMVPLHVTPSDTLNQVAARSNSPVAVPINPNVLAESNQLQGK